MITANGRTLSLAAFAVVLSQFPLWTPSLAAASEALSPAALAVSSDGSTLYIAERTARQVAVFDIGAKTVSTTIPMPAEPTGLALSPDGRTLYVTCAAPQGTLCLVSTESQKVVRKIEVGYGAQSPVVLPNGKRAYVCNRFENDISVIDLKSNKEIGRVPVGREPSAAAVTPDGALLFVTQHIPDVPSDRDVVAASVRVIHTQGLQVVAEIALPNGSMALKDVCISPDGRYAFVTHVLARFHMPTTQLERGWVNTNALSIIDVTEHKLVNTVLVDDIDRGAANPWGVDCTPDGKFLCVTHAGTHELSLIDLPALIEKLLSVPRYAVAAGSGAYDYAPVSSSVVDVPDDLTFLVGLRRRIRLEGRGPRAVVVLGNQAYVANYFSDDLNAVGIAMEGRASVESLPLGASTTEDLVRTGERLFFDATICFQGWHSCATCHPDTRVDGLNWDLLNDGLGNPKNTKSLLLSHETPPAMGTGVRATAEAAVRAGIRHILFLVRPEEEAEAIDAYLKALQPTPSPYRDDKKMRSAAKRGKKLFMSADTACASCHSGPLYTDLSMYDVGSKGPLDRRDRFDTPTLVELWRTAPFLHDGRSATLRDVLTTHNPEDRHGYTSQLTEKEIADLEAFLLSL